MQRLSHDFTSSQYCMIFALLLLSCYDFMLILIDGRDFVMDYLCAKFGDFSFSRFGFIVRTDRQNHRLMSASLII